jgi:hypothetical protein
LSNDYTLPPASMNSSPSYRQLTTDIPFSQYFYLADGERPAIKLKTIVNSERKIMLTWSYFTVPTVPFTLNLDVVVKVRVFKTAGLVVLTAYTEGSVWIAATV